jgi:alpha-D-xyloside xylohydrolase
MKKSLVSLLSLLLCCAALAQGDVHVQFYSPTTVRIVKGGAAPANSFAVTASPQPVAVRTSATRGDTVYDSGALKVSVSADGTVRFLSPKGKLLLKEGAWGLETISEGLDQGLNKVRQTFLPATDEPFYGLGILQDGALSLRGKTRRMIQDNTEDFVPVVQSVKGYGIFWDNPSPTVFRDDAEGMHFESEVGEAVDYYFIWGGDADGVIAGIRALTGHVPMLPMWSYGFMQSRERYKSSQELLDVLHGYRERNIPIDCIIQDWQYWGNNYLWNAMEFLNDDFRNAQAMIDEVHAQHAKLMISIWASFGPMTKAYRELEPKGLLFDFETWPRSGLPDWPPRMDYPSGVKPYNPYSQEARDIYWKNLLRLENMGIDAWWMDSTEPDHHSFKESDLDFETGVGSFRRVRNAFPLVSVEGVTDNQKTVSERRVMILTRSAYAGQQRTGANTWSGDVASSWESLRAQVPAGLGFALTGNPNFNSDCGGFFPNGYNRIYGDASCARNPLFQELYVRWLQYGAFCPMMRSHGESSRREIWEFGAPGEPVYDAIEAAIRLRYKLLPYIYSTAHEVTAEDGTFQRALVMDFPADKAVWNCADEFLFGRELLVAPVVHAQYTPEKVAFDATPVDFAAARSTQVYLPKGCDWYDFATGVRVKGGQTLTRETHLDTVPLYVRAGSIIPLGPDVQYTGEKPWDDLEIRVYPGADGRFVLYEDEGDSYRYEQGACSTIAFTLRGRTLTVGAREGAFPGMLQTRRFRVVTPDGTVRELNYDGSAQKIQL